MSHSHHCRCLPSEPDLVSKGETKLTHIKRGVKLAYWRFFWTHRADLHVFKRANTSVSRTTKEHTLW